MYGCVLNAYARVLGALGRGRAHMAVSFGYIRDSIRCAQWRTRRACSPRSVRSSSKKALAIVSHVHVNFEDMFPFRTRTEVYQNIFLLIYIFCCHLQIYFKRNMYKEMEKKTRPFFCISIVRS